MMWHRSLALIALVAVCGCTSDTERAAIQVADAESREEGLADKLGPAAIEDQGARWLVRYPWRTDMRNRELGYFVFIDKQTMQVTETRSSIN